MLAVFPHILQASVIVVHRLTMSGRITNIATRTSLAIATSWRVRPTTPVVVQITWQGIFISHQKLRIKKESERELRVDIYVRTTAAGFGEGSGGERVVRDERE
jgi:hypothetical protein